MKAWLEKLLARQDLTREEAAEMFDQVMAGNATPAQVAGTIIALRMKGETAAEIAGAAGSMRRHAVFIDTRGAPVVDTCGTGGDKCGTFNISTTAAFVVAGAGVKVAKHGNRAISSRSGSADVLAALGVKIEASTETIEDCIEDVGLGFLFAPRMHPAMKHAMGARRELGVRTIFNVLGPLTNPAGARDQLIGVFDPRLTETLAEVLRLLGSRRAFVVHGNDGMDELTTTTTSRISELKDGSIRTYEFDPLPYIEGYATLEELAGGTPEDNAAIAARVLEGEPGPARDIVQLNAAAALVAGGRTPTFEEGWRLAGEAIDSGSAQRVLDGLVKRTNEEEGETKT